MPVISVIIPVYNVGAYLDQCVQSVKKQTFSDWELILIDDGSTDNSPQICDRHSKDDARIHVVHQPNHGVAFSRNTGIRMARGEWVAFVDSDDWLEPDYLQILHQGAISNDSDVAICGRYEEHQNARRPLAITKGTAILTAQEAIQKVYQRDLQSCLWSMLLHRSIMQEPVPSFSRYEDHAVLYKWFSHGRQVVLLPDLPYHFRVRKSSLMHQNSSNGELELMPIVSEMYEFIHEHQILPDNVNRSIAAQNYIRIAKEVARSQDKSKKRILQSIRKAIAPLLPVDLSITGSKPYRRIRLLMFSPALFIRVLSFSQLFVLKHKPSSRIPFE